MAEADCRKLLRGPHRGVSLFRRQWHMPAGCHIVEIDPKRGFHHSYDWDEEMDDLPDSGGIPIEAVADFLAGDGYQVE